MTGQVALITVTDMSQYAMQAVKRAGIIARKYDLQHMVYEINNHGGGIFGMPEFWFKYRGCESIKYIAYPDIGDQELFLTAVIAEGKREIDIYFGGLWC